MIKFDLDFTQNVQVYMTSLRFSSAAEYCTVQENILFLPALFYSVHDDF
jgi:hypothetical protein